MKWAAILALAAAAAGVSSAQSPCPTGFTNLNDDPAMPPVCVSFLLSTGTWNSMRQLCMMMNADLAVITGDLHQLVYQHIKKTPGLWGQCYWAGGSDAASEGSWTWVPNGSQLPLGAPHWDPCNEEPNGKLKENYLCLCSNNRYHFSDCAGDLHMSAICLL